MNKVEMKIRKGAICAKCGKEMKNTDIKYPFKDGQFICQDCYFTYRLPKESNLPQIEDVPWFPEGGLFDVKFPNREDYSSLAAYSLEYLYQVNGSDLHLKVGSFPIIRKGGRLYKIWGERLTEEDILSFAYLYSKSTEDLKERMKTIDYSFNYKDVRFRSNFFHDVNGPCLSLRLLRLFSTDFEVLGLPKALKELATRRSGLILITGPTGSGKSTSLAAILSYLNLHTSSHILTLEDPIEYIHENKGCIISQREIGKDCSSYDQAIMELLREDPDVIMIGEMRDNKSIEAALRAVETGHLVLSTLHTRGSASTVTRIVESFPIDEQNQIRNQLAGALLGICSQQLVPSTTPGEVCLATELLLADQPIQASIRTNKLTMISSLVQMGKAKGMHSMHDSLEKLYNDKKISKEDFENYQIAE